MRKKGRDKERGEEKEEEGGGRRTSNENEDPPSSLWWEFKCTLAANPNILVFRVAFSGLEPSAIDGKCLVSGC